MENRITESESLYTNLEQLSIREILEGINNEDQKVAAAVKKELPAIENFISALVPRMRNGGRLFYMGAGTSGRLGIVDASECPPTFGVEQGVIIGIIAGGDSAIRKAVEFAEDDLNQGWVDLKSFNITKLDTVVGIAASGTTPYVLGALEKCNEIGILTCGISCNTDSLLNRLANFSISIVVGPEFLTGSTRMKSGTAQKLVLNMISTSAMIQLGKVKGNRMVDMQLSNNKLVERGTQMVMLETNLNAIEAKELLLKTGSVREAVQHHFYSKKTE